MRGDPKFSRPGYDGKLPQGTSTWRKGMVYTTRVPGSSSAGTAYRVSAGIKCGPQSSSSEIGFSKLYNRVSRVAAGSISSKICTETGVAPKAVLSGHTWGTFGDGTGIAFALVVMGARCSPLPPSAQQDAATPAQEALFTSGGASPQELAILSPQRSDEIYNEFDFAGPTDKSPITLSYGEPFAGTAFHFEPAVQRAEQLAANYHSFLSSLGEVHSPSLKILHREWFFASDSFATIHICFDR
jgi:hypothetical protein